MNTEQDFFTNIAKDPKNIAIRLAYADWLEERGDPRGEFVRLQGALTEKSESDDNFEDMQKRKEAMRDGIQMDWQIAMGYYKEAKKRGEVDNCKMKFTCPLQWNDLRPTESKKIRFCTECKNRVYFCETDVDRERHAILGHCIAHRPPRQEIMTLGIPIMPDLG